MKQKEQKNSKRRLNSLILLVAFTAIMLIVSTYAWFSAQKNVTISNLEGVVKVVEGLEISLDAKHWSQAVDLKAAQEEGSIYLDTGKTLVNAYDGCENVLSSELKPVSTTGTAGSGIGQSELQMYRGTTAEYSTATKSNINGLYGIQLVDKTKVTDANANDADYAGYHAIDLFLKNTSASGITEDKLQLNLNSILQLKNSSLETTGLQNTVRVAFAYYTPEPVTADNVVDGTGAVTTYADLDVTNPDQTKVIEATVKKGSDYRNIGNVAIWEPNSNSHADEIVTKFANKMTWNTSDVTVDPGTSYPDGKTADDYVTTKGFNKKAVFSTYALTNTSLTAAQTFSDNGTTRTGIADIYDWNTVTDTGMQKQVTLQTESGATVDVNDLINVADSSTFTIPANKVSRIRMYVWLEGQDPDTVNLASHGGGIKLDVGLVKPGLDS